MRIVPFLRGPLAAAALVLLAAGCSGDDDGPTAAPAASGSSSPGSAAATPTTPPAGSATGSDSGTRSPAAPPTATSAGPVAVSPLPPAPVGRDAEVLSGVAITMTRVADVRVSASGPGEIAGPGAAVTLRVRNGGGAPFDLDSLAVTGSYGRGTPADPSGSAQAKPLQGSLGPGRTAEGTYYFLVPAAQKATLRIEVSSSASPRIAVFER